VAGYFAIGRMAIEMTGLTTNYRTQKSFSS
jgi:hypothetical protein